MMGATLPACSSWNAMPVHSKPIAAGRFSRAISSIASMAWPELVPGAGEAVIWAVRKRL